MLDNSKLLKSQNKYVSKWMSFILEQLRNAIFFTLQINQAKSQQPKKPDWIKSVKYRTNKFFQWHILPRHRISVLSIFQASADFQYTNSTCRLNINLNWKIIILQNQSNEQKIKNDAKVITRNAEQVLIWYFTDLWYHA